MFKGKPKPTTTPEIDAAGLAARTIEIASLVTEATRLLKRCREIGERVEALGGHIEIHGDLTKTYDLWEYSEKKAKSFGVSCIQTIK